MNCTDGFVGVQPQNNLMVDTVDGKSMHPDDLVCDATTRWAQLWKPTEDDSNRSVQGVQLGPVDGQLMADIAERLRLKAAGGPDGWRAPELRVLPDWIWHRAAQVCDVAELHGEWPVAMRQGTVALIPKEGATNTGELRPIVILPFVYRIWAASRRVLVKAWEVGEGAHSSDVLGRGAEEAAWELALQAECFNANGESIVGCFLDCSKCYERVNFDMLLEECIRKGFPAKIANLAVNMYSGTRYIRFEGTYGPGIRATCGIMPGCPVAVALLKAYLKEVVETAEVEENVQVRKYVDDIALWSAGSARVAAKATVDAYRSVAQALGKVQAVVNIKKTVFVANSKKAERIIQRITDEGEPKVVSTTRDLGVDVMWRKVRGKTQYGRLSTAKQRAGRCGILTMSGKFRATATAASVLAHAMYGSVVNGLNASQMTSLKLLAKRALVGIKRNRAIPEVILSVLNDPAKVDPRTRHTLAVLDAWAVRGPKHDTERVEAIWRSYMDGGKRAKGPVSTCLESLEYMGWVPYGPVHWTNGGGELIDATDRMQVRRLALMDLEKARWKEVTAPGRRPKDCAGAESGIHPCTSLLWTKMIKNKQHAAAGAMRCILTGATWPAVRKKKAGFQDWDACPRCELEPEDVMHRWWRCPAFEDIRRLTGGNIIRARPNFPQMPAALLECGLVPRDYAENTMSQEMEQADEARFRHHHHHRGGGHRRLLPPW